MEQADIKATAKQRAAFILGAIVMLVLWGGSLIPAIESWGDPREDGFSIVPATWATITVLPLGSFALVGAITGRGKHAARASNAAVCWRLCCCSRYSGGCRSRWPPKGFTSATKRLLLR